ncbi:hypothetical protein RF11_04895 [Thelohanellus kitauei]|uniref:Zinc finger BED domain-containing protein 5 n=1 Tax=Thelohanellus kitauei TaxID=669202 RepID=A0A0C2MMG2_THEKT|nr:hypothetical protein RF11_04895 [Thelohanellus kitauei]
MKSEFQKPCTIAEELILSAIVNMYKIVIGREFSPRLKATPLSDNNVGRKIAGMSEGALCPLIGCLQCVKFEFQLDECTDIANADQFMVYIRYCLEGRIADEEIFCVLDEFVEESGLAWTQCPGECTDGTAVMTSRKSGLVERIKLVTPQIVSTHCMVFR